MKKVITYGTFDLFHNGHLQILRRARALGDYLVVAISSDDFNLREKNKKCVYPYSERAAIVGAMKYVDLVIPEENWEQKRKDIFDHDIDVFVMGDDWKGKFDDLADVCDVVYLPRTPGISTTSVKSSIHSPGEGGFCHEK